MKRAIAIVQIMLLMTCVIARAQTMQPSTAPATRESTEPAMSPEAAATLDQLRDAYGNLKSLDLAGRVMFDSDIMGEAKSSSVDFVATFRAPNRFRHEIKDQNVAVSTGQKVYLYVRGVGKYLEDSAPADRVAMASLNEQVRRVLASQNPSLSLALVEDARDELLEGARSVSKLDDVQLDERPFDVVRIERDDGDVSLLIDRQTHLLRQVRRDESKRLVRSGVPAVKKALVTIDYTRVAPDVAVHQDQVAWSPPADAILVRAQIAAADADGAPHPLQGKAAPDFTLPDLNDQPVHLADLRGSVVVLDFWATWCGPCREGLPHLDKLNAELAPQGVKVFAINLREDKAKAKAFMTEHNLALTTLLDERGDVAAKYAVEGIPQTVVIGKNRIVRNVIVGFDPTDGETGLRKAIELALRER